MAVPASLGSSRLSWPAWIVVAGAIITGWLIVQSIVTRLTLPWPLNPWESAIVMDAHRTTRGTNVYRQPGPATHMYGPLITYTNAAVFLITGPNLYSPRYVALVSSLLLTLAMVLVLARRSGWLVMAIAAVLVFSQFFRTRAAYAEARPDVPAMLFAFLSLCLLYRGHRIGSWLSTLLGSIVAVVAFGFKQTAASIVVIPMVAVLLERPSSLRDQLLRALTPILAVGLAMLAVKAFWPAAAYYMFDVPRKFELRPERWQFHLLTMLACSTLFVAACALYLSNPRSLEQRRGAVQWTLVSSVVLLASCTVVAAKQGGAVNSYLPAFLAMAAFVVLCLPELLRVATAQGSLPRRIVGALLIALLMPADLLAVPNNSIFTNHIASHGHAAYGDAIECAQRLPGRVICPDDPTILLFAKGYLGRSYHCECDTTGNLGIPGGMRREIQRANWLIRVNATWATQSAKIPLAEMGYRRVDEPSLRGTRYSLWHRGGSPSSRPAIAPTTSSTTDVRDEDEAEVVTDVEQQP